MTHSRVRALLVVLIAVLSLAATPSHADSVRQLRVATYNIHHGVGNDGKLDLERIAQVIQDSGAQVIGLQEVDRHHSVRSDFVDQAKWLGTRLGMHAVFGANIDRDPPEPGAERQQYGTAILSTYKIREWRNTLLPRPQGGEQRGLLEARIKVRGVDVRVLTTHLQHNSQVERIAQVAAIRDLLAESPDPIILTGDTNALPDSAEMVTLKESLADAWDTAGQGDGLTYSTDNPRTRIDYVMSSPDVRATSATVVDTDASDHFPVVVDVELPSPA
ncbi:endonuclease/exonuclease/phosphatase family protein [Nonomuraea sp. 3N208]|uniref:endonuclease/exonuclease/phosphatase family protein n=1 Tax=Nonomuraea sp. 3N208 TaxID=3457421 RepID=UPI003FD09DE6